MIAASEVAIRDAVEASSLPRFDDKLDTFTHTIDLDNLVYADVTKTGTFDLRRIGSTSLGRLMDSLPVPASRANRTSVPESGDSKRRSAGSQVRNCRIELET